MYLITNGIYFEFSFPPDYQLVDLKFGARARVANETGFAACGNSRAEPSVLLNHPFICRAVCNSLYLLALVHDEQKGY